MRAFLLTLLLFEAACATTKVQTAAPAVPVKSAETAQQPSSCQQDDPDETGTRLGGHQKVCSPTTPKP